MKVKTSFFTRPQPLYADGTNLSYETQFVAGFTSRVLPWYLPSESVAPGNWEEKWDTVRRRFETVVDNLPPVHGRVKQTRVPAFNYPPEHLSDDLTGVFLGTPGLQLEPARLSPVNSLPLAPVFCIKGAQGDLVTNSGSPEPFRFGLRRYHTLTTDEAARRTQHDWIVRFKGVLGEAGHLLYSLPAPVASSLWQNWQSGFSKRTNSAVSLWLDALFELSWQNEPGSALFADRYYSEGAYSVQLFGTGLFPLIPKGVRGESLIATEADYPPSFISNLNDVARASVAGVDELLSRARKQTQRDAPRPARAENESPSGSDLQRSMVFISYSHKDCRFVDELRTHLKPLERESSISAWSDHQIAPGSKWLDEIESNLARSKVAVLLVSKDFLASDFIHKKELQPILARAVEGGLKVLWVLVHDCNWKMSPIKDFQAAYPTAKPLAHLRAARNRAWVSICEQIEKTVRE